MRRDPIAHFSSLLAQSPDDELARFSLGKAYFDAGQFGPAKEQLELALAIKPTWMAAQILLGKCELALGDRAAAKTALSRAHQLAKIQNHPVPLAETRQLLAELG
jgi:Flp pilus assembly protein TadD